MSRQGLSDTVWPVVSEKVAVLLLVVTAFFMMQPRKAVELLAQQGASPVSLRYDFLRPFHKRAYKPGRNAS